LQQEIRQTRPFRSLGHEAAVGLLRSADHLRRQLAATLEPHGVTAQQYNVLRILRGAGDAGLPTLEIAGRMIEHAPGITRLLDRLEGKGWVERWRCRDDRRQVLCRISATGLALLAALDRPVAAVDERCFAALSPEEQGQLVALLDAVRGHPRSTAESREPADPGATAPASTPDRREPS
jgi:DNA-binding MarR family transcriptional regulator